MPTRWADFTPSWNQVGKFDTVFELGVKIAHQVGKFDTVLKLGVKSAHQVGKLYTVLEPSGQIRYRL